ncbi:unnamed protein product, partial [Sphagnum compactum]
ASPELVKELGFGQLEQHFIDEYKSTATLCRQQKTGAEIMSVTNDDENKDFYNLADVYLDAVFHPHCVDEVHTFQQEGWHYELNDPSEDITYKGVVFNEMKVVFSQPDNVLGRVSQQALFPDNTYGVDPSVIPNLTFQQFQEFHAKFYHPSNACVWFYGDDDPDQHLRILSAYLAEFEASASAKESKVMMQRLFSEPRVVEKHAVGDEGDMKKKHMVCLNWVLLDARLDPETELALGFLDHLMLGTPGSPLRKFCWRVESVKPLWEVVFRMSSVSLSLGKWLYGGDPLEPLHFAKPLEQLKHGLSAEGVKAVLSPVIQKYILDNPPRMTVELQSQITGGGHGIAAARMGVSQIIMAVAVEIACGGVQYPFALSWKDAIVNLTADDRTLTHAESHVATLLDTLPGLVSWDQQLPLINEGLVIPTEVNYVGKAASLYNAGYELNGSAYVISTFIGKTWLSDQVCVSDGAYGGFFDFDSHSGVFSFLSYRDPNPVKTLDNYDGTVGLPDAKGYTRYVS